MNYTNPTYKNHVMKSEPAWLIVEASTIRIAKQAISIGKRCAVPKCKITVKDYTGQIENFATVTKIKL